MKVFGCWVATERHQVWLDDARTAARPDRAVGRACPASIGVVGRADRERIHAIRWNLHAVVAELAVPFSVIANSHGHERVAVAEQLVDNGGPSVDFPVLHFEIGAQAQVDELVGPRQQNLLDETQCAIQLQWIFAARLLVQHAQMVHRGKRPAGRTVGLDRTEQHGRGHAQAMLRTVRIIVGVFVELAVRAQPGADRMVLGQATVQDGDTRFG